MKRISAIVISAFLLLAGLPGSDNRAGASILVQSGGAPGLVSYQGKVSLNDRSYNGQGYFKFAIVDLSGTTSFWSNDGTSIGGSQPAGAVQLQVASGLFNVLLGEPGMSPLTAAAFSQSGRALRVWFSADNLTFTQLDPDRTIASVPFALQAQQAADSTNLNGQPGSFYLDAGNLNAGTLNTSRYSAYADLGAEGYLDGNAPGDLLSQAKGDARYGVPSQYLGKFWVNVADPENQVGTNGSLTIGSDGLGLISYKGGGNPFGLKVLHCGNAACNSGNTITLVEGAIIGTYTSITIGMDGLGLVSYTDNANLKVLHCSNIDCTSSTVTPIGLAGSYSSATIGSDGFPVISFYDGIGSDLDVLHCETQDCSGAGHLVTPLDTAGNVGMYTSIAIGKDGYPLISYYDADNHHLKVVHCLTPYCNLWDPPTTVDTSTSAGMYSSITTGADGLGLVSYYDDNANALKVLHCGNLACSSGNTITTADTGGVGRDTSIIIGPDGLGMIAYYDITQTNLKVLHCGNYRCDYGNVAVTLDAAGNTGQTPSIAIGPDGQALISYFDTTTIHLKVVKMLGLGRR